MQSFDIDLPGFSTILQTPGAWAPGRPDAVVVLGGPIETVLLLTAAPPSGREPEVVGHLERPEFLGILRLCGRNWV